MNTYRIAGTTVNCTFPLAELVTVQVRQCQLGDNPWTIEWDATEAGNDGWEDHRELSDGDADWPTIERFADRYLLRFGEVASFSVHPASRRIVCHPSPDSDDGLFRHLLLDQVLPRAFGLGECLVLHASAVSTPGGVLAFTGPSGSGKSTMATSFLSEGYALLADDFLVVWDTECRLWTAPSYPSLRLWPDTALSFDSIGNGATAYAKESAKLRVSSGPLGEIEGRHRLATVVVLDVTPSPHSPFRLHPLRGHHAMMALYTQTFRLNGAGPGGPEGELDRFGRLVQETAILSLEFQRDYSVLPAIRESILSWTRSSSV